MLLRRLLDLHEQRTTGGAAPCGERYLNPVHAIVASAANVNNNDNEIRIDPSTEANNVGNSFTQRPEAAVNMIKSLPASIIVILLSSLAVSDAAPSGTKGQNYDRIVIETHGEEEIDVVVRIMTLNRLPTSGSTIVVTDNGQPLLGPERLEQERWSKTIAIRGEGRHEIVAICGAINAEPVYCSLRADIRSAALAQ